MKKGKKLGDQSYVAYLIEQGQDDELMHEVSGVAEMTGKTTREVADGFKAAFYNIKKNKDDDAYKKLNEIQDEMLEHEKNKVDDSVPCFDSKGKDISK